MKNLLVLMSVLVFFVVFGCEDYEDAIDSAVDDGVEIGTVSMAVSDFCGDFRYGMDDEVMDGEYYEEFYSTDQDDDSVIVCLNPDGNFYESYYVTLYRRGWLYDHNCGTKVFTPPTPGGDVEHTWYNTCVQPDAEYYVKIWQTNPLRWVCGGYGMSSY